jgi:UDP-glucose:(heptosyl)LPS alpha-1,3-glucosyltransferase
MPRSTERTVKKLALVLFEWFPHGGMQQDLLKIAEACNLEFDITVICMKWNGEFPKSLRLLELPSRRLTKVGKREEFVARVQVLRNEFDCVLGFNKMPGLDYYYAADNSFAWKVLYERPLWYRLLPRTRQYLKFERAVCSPLSSTKLLFLSPLQRKQYLDIYRIDPLRLTLLPPGIRRSFKAPVDAALTRTQLRKELGLPNDALLVLQVGSSFRTKGVNRSLEALATLPSSLSERVHYINIGRDELFSWQQKAQQLGLNKVSFLGGREDVQRYMLAADLLIHPSLSESAGMVLLEAIASGLPVLTTASCGYAFHVVKAKAGIVTSEPFEQTRFNDEFRFMLEEGLLGYKEHALRYSREQDLYGLPEQLAHLLSEATQGLGRSALKNIKT